MPPRPPPTEQERLAKLGPNARRWVIGLLQERDALRIQARRIVENQPTAITLDPYGRESGPVHLPDEGLIRFSLSPRNAQGPETYIDVSINPSNPRQLKIHGVYRLIILPEVANSFCVEQALEWRVRWENEQIREEAMPAATSTRRTRSSGSGWKNQGIGGTGA